MQYKVRVRAVMNGGNETLQPKDVLTNTTRKTTIILL